MAPEPAPVVVVAKAAPPPPSATQAPTSSQANAPSTTPRASVVTPTLRQPPADTRRIVRAKPTPRVDREETKAIKSFAGAIEKRAAGLSLGAGFGGNDSSNRLLFLGGLALLFLVLGDAAFLAFTARMLRDPTER
jgi:hypothetical protein